MFEQLKRLALVAAVLRAGCRWQQRACLRSKSSVPAALPLFMSSIIRRLTRGLLAALPVALMAACGGSGDPAGGEAVVTPATVVKVEIAQKGLLFTASGQSSQLTAIATDANGGVQKVPVTWTSSKPAVIAVDATGKATAQVASGSGQIVAQAAGVRSAPLLVIATAVAPGAVLLTDAQIVGNPVETSPGAEPSLSNTYQVALSGVAPPAIGSVLINTESKVVGGRVVAVDASANPMTVTLQLVPVIEMFPTLQMQETIDLSDAEVTIPPDVSAVYNIVRSGNTFTFTPKPGQGASAAKRASASVPTAHRQIAAAAAAPVKFKLGLFDCEITATGLDRLPVTLTAPPAFSVTASPTMDISFNVLRSFGFDRLVIKAEPTFAVEFGLSLAVGFDGKVECKKEFFAYVVPAGGPLALVFGGVVPMGLGLEAAGKVTAATLGIGAKAEISSKIVAGINCPSVVVFFCEFEGSTKDSTAKFTPTIDLPSIGDIRLEPSLSAFGYLEATIGNVFFKSLRFEFVKAKVGATLAGSFALKESQLADAAYASSYKLSLDASVGTGAKMGAVLQMLGAPDVAAAEVKLSTDIAKSPKGLAGATVTADKANFVAGDLVTFTVKLDPATVDFLPVVGPYNVKSVQLVRKENPNLTIVPVVGTAAAVGGQTEFTFLHAATSAGTASQFSAFVVTQLAPFDFLSLELGTAAGNSLPGVFSGVVNVIADLIFPTSGQKVVTAFVRIRVNADNSTGEVIEFSGTESHSFSREQRCVDEAGSAFTVTLTDIGSGTVTEATFGEQGDARLTLSGASSKTFQIDTDPRGECNIVTIVETTPADDPGQFALLIPKIKLFEGDRLVGLDYSFSKADDNLIQTITGILLPEK